MFRNLNLSVFTLQLFYFTSTAALFAQESTYSLLWKIEADTLTKPSYLFGTMHVDDAKVFNFSDAVMPAIENSDFFALEVEPDKLIEIYNSKTYDVKAFDFYKDLLPPEYFEKLMERFQVMNKISLEESGIYNPDEVISLITPDPDKEDDKTTFVDMYLYSIAETLRRTVVGLEDPRTQVDYFDNMSREEKIEHIKSYLDYGLNEFSEERDNMADIYSKGDLSAIEAYMKSQNYDYHDLVDRNYVMRNSIIDFMKQGSIFAAVGAAHLPGEKGLINLLKQEGYKVSVVEANFTGVADTYKIDESKKKWYTFVDDTLNFKVKIPKAPNISDDFELFKIYGYADLATSTNYMFMGYKTGFDFAEDMQPVLMNKLIENVIIKRGATSPIIDSIQEGDRLIYKIESDLNETNKIKAEIILKNNCIYYFSAEGKGIDTPSITRFFKSIEVEGIEKDAIINPQWQTIEHKEGKFKITIPFEPKDISRESPNPLDPSSEPYVLNLFMSTDVNNNNNYLYRYNDQPIGYYTVGAEQLFSDTEQTFGNKATLIGDPKIISLNGYEGREYKMLIQNKFHSVARLYIRGNRTYLLLKQKLNLKDKADTKDSFFEDFELTPYAPMKVNYTTLENDIISVDLFEKVKQDRDTIGYEDAYIKSSHEYFTVNPETGGVYHLSFSDLKKYFRTNSLKSLYGEYKDSLLEWTDTIVGESINVKGVDSTFFFKVKNKDRMNKPELKHYSFGLTDSRLVITESIITEEEYNTGIYNHIIESIKFKPNKNPVDIYAPKANIIFKDLKSQDTTFYKSALASFNYYEFLEEELPSLYEALNDHYPNELNSNVVNEIIDEFSFVSNEETSKILKNFYLKTNDKGSKALILGTLSDLKSEDRLEVYRELLSQEDAPTGDHNYNYGILRPFRDSLNFTTANSDLLYELMSKKELRSDIIDITKNIIVNDSISLTRFSDGYDELFRFIEFDWNKYSSLTDETDNYFNALHSYLDFLNVVEFSNASIDKVTQEILDGDSDSWLRLRALLARLNINLELNEKTFKRYIDDLYFRFELMEVLHKNGELKKVPKPYLNPIEFGKLSLFNYVVDDTAIPKDLKYLETINKGDYAYAVYSILYDGYTYLGIADITTSPLVKENFEQYRSYSDFNEIEEDWQTQAQEYIKSLEEDLD